MLLLTISISSVAAPLPDDIHQERLLAAATQPAMTPIFGDELIDGLSKNKDID